MYVFGGMVWLLIDGVLVRKARGDHYVTVKVAIPKELAEDERKLLEELQEKRGGKVPKGNSKKASKGKVG